MRLQQIQKSYLYEGLDRSASNTMMLWESAGVKLREAALTADQIQQLFAAVEKSATAQGDNRTMLGKGKDAVSAVNKAWEDLKTKIQDSGPIKGFDQKVSDALSKIGMGTADPQFNGEVNKWVQKYRDFAKKHPIAQGAIYATLIGLAGITGAGVGGAAALGLLKMADKLLQGERFSSAAYSGAKTGAMAYGASKLGDYLKGGDKAGSGGGEVPADIQQGLAADQAFQDRLLNKFPPDKGYTFSSSGKSLQVFDANGTKVFTGDIPLKTMDMKTFADLTNNGQMATPGISSGSISSDAMAGVSDAASSKAGDTAFDAMGKAKELRTALGGADTDAATDLTSKVAQAASEAPKGANMNPDYLQQVIDGQVSRPKISADAAKAALDWQAQNGGQAVDAAAAVANNPGSSFSKDYLEKVISGEHPRPMISKDKAAELLKQMDGAAAPADAAEKTLNLRPRFKRPAESYSKSGRTLSEGQVYLVFNRVCARNERMLSESVLVEGPLDAIKGAAGKAASWLQTKGKNLTTKVTADKLNSAWQKAGSPTDSGELAKFLQSQGVNNTVVDQVFKDLKIPTTAPATATQEPAQDQPQGQAQAVQNIEQVKAMIAKLPTDRKVRLVNYMTKQLKVA